MTYSPFFSEELPAFQSLQPQHACLELQQMLEESRQRIAAITQSVETPTWENIVEPLEDISARIHDLWSPISHLNAVTNTAAWREAYHACLPILTEFSTALGLNDALYQKIQALQSSATFETLAAVQKKIITDQIRDFKLAGVTLAGEEKKRYSEIQQRISELSTQFEDNVLDATQHWHYVTTNVEDLAGLPEHVRQFSTAKAAEKNLSGYVLTLDAPIYSATMKYAENRELREKMYIAYSTRASDMGPDANQFDNTAIMLELLRLKAELAQLLGFTHYADYSLATKMAGSVAQVQHFLRDLAQKSQPFALQEVAELTKFAQRHLAQEPMQAWDIAFFSEKLQQEVYAFNEESLRPYFPINQVLFGMFAIIEKIYGMQVTERYDVETWHQDVRFFEIFDEAHQLRGQFYVDLLARERKRGGAWMDVCRTRRTFLDKISTPVAYLTCNFSPASDQQPVLLTHDEVITLFHEFGHGLQHLLTQVEYSQVAGISGVEWDAVELPSQFMENFCWEKSCLPLLSQHFQTKQPLPASLFQGLLRAKNFQSALQMLRQVEFALFDISLYSQPAPADALALQHILNTVRTAVAVLFPPQFNRFQHSFAHIFSGGYAAGYYSYKWAEVLSSDVFAQFEAQGVLDRATGKAFLHALLERGGSEPAMTLLVNFLGREPQVDALLRHHGLCA